MLIQNYKKKNVNVASVKESDLRRKVRLIYGM